MFLNVRAVGFGALPAFPSRLLTPQGGKLKPNHEWVRYYEVDYQHQLKVCPKFPPFGCYLVNGYAWGQREWYPDEFAPAGFMQKPLPKPFPKPLVAMPVAKPVTTTVVAPKPKPTPILQPVPVFVAPTPPIVVPPVVPPQITIVDDTQPEAGDETQPQTRLLPGASSLVGIGLFVVIGLTLLRKFR